MMASLKKKELYVNRYISNIVRSRTLKNIKTHDLFQYLQALVWLKTPVNLTVPSTTITKTRPEKPQTLTVIYSQYNFSSEERVNMTVYSVMFF